ncbi:MAG: phosphodiesterase [Erysipelotrichaceae bacterium]|nr:phosphodiesterase [Erysipelotrichaceae bacterium]
MKLMIASDIHGSAYYCEKMLKAFEEEKADKLLLLGDFLYHGPRNDLPKDYDPKAVAEMLNRMKDKILAIKGNCDSEVDQMMLEFPIMADYALIEANGITIYATHGHIHNMKNPLPMNKGILLCGHTHVPALEEMNSFTYLNPGSIAIPKQDSSFSYMILEDKTFFWKDLETLETYKEYKFEQ